MHFLNLFRQKSYSTPKLAILMAPRNKNKLLNRIGSNSGTGRPRISTPPEKITKEIEKTLGRVFLHLSIAEGIHKEWKDNCGSGARENGKKEPADERENELRLVEHVGKGNTAAARILLIGLDANLKDGQGWPLITLASQNGDLNMVNLLVSRGARTDESNPWGWTPLMFAALNGHTKVAGFLLSEDADPSIENNSGLTARNIAEDNGHMELAELIKEYERA